MLAHEDQLLRLARTDSLTNLANHGYMQELVDDELERAARYRRALTLILIDIDHFKQLYDQYGHQTGDAVLQQLANVAHSLVRNNDHLARYGGEEFLLILPETTAEQGARFGERLRQSIVMTRFQIDGVSLEITVSLGLVS